MLEHKFVLYCTKSKRPVSDMKKTRQELVKYRDLFNNNTGEGLLEVGIIHLEDNTVVDTDPPEILQFMKGVDNE